MEAAVRCDHEPFRHTDFSKSEQLGEIKEENSEDTSEIMTHSHSDSSKSSRSSSDDHLEALPIIIPKSPQTKPPKPQEMSSDDDEDYRLSGHLFELPSEILTLSSFSFSRVPAISTPSRNSGAKSPPADWSMVSNDSLFSLAIGSHSFSRDWNKPTDIKSPEKDNMLREFDSGYGSVFMNSNKSGPGKNVRVQWDDPNIKTYSFAVENQVPRIPRPSQPSAIEPVEKSSSSSSSSSSSCVCSGCSSCSSWWKSIQCCSSCCSMKPCSCNLVLCNSRFAFSCFE